MVMYLKRGERVEVTLKRAYYLCQCACWCLLHTITHDKIMGRLPAHFKDKKTENRGCKHHTRHKVIHFQGRTRSCLGDLNAYCALSDSFQWAPMASHSQRGFCQQRLSALWVFRAFQTFHRSPHQKKVRYTKKTQVTQF